MEHWRAISVGIRASALSLVLLFAVDRSAIAAGTPDQVGSWGPVLDWGLQGKHMVLMPTGNVLVWPNGDKAQVWNPSTGAFTLAPATFGDLHCAAQTLLPDGRPIVIGGVNGPPHVGTKVTAIFDPYSNTWFEGEPMHYARWYGTATVLPDGRVLATGGDDQDGNSVTIPEIYDPTSNSWTVLSGASRNQGLYPFMYVLPDGRVFQAGASINTALLDVAGDGSWSSGPPNTFGSNSYSECDAMYGTGKIIRSGGGDPAVARVSVIDMTSSAPQWREIAPMAFARRRHNLVVLLDGSVMAVGGTASSDNESQAVLAGEIWNPVTERWTTVASMNEARMYHSAAVLLPDGRVVSAGGEAAGRLHAQIYSPPYLFKGQRPNVTSAPPSAAYGSTFAISTLDAGNIDRVALLRSTAETHAIDMNQRYVPLTFSASSGSLTVNAPSNANIAPPGYYLLSIRNTAGVPSVARWIRIDSSVNLVPGTIQGRITAASSGSGLSGAIVAYSGGSATTNATGDYALANVSPGEHHVTASASGYAVMAKSVYLAPGAAVTTDFALSPPGSVVGHLTNARTGSPVGSANVSYDGGTVRTDQAGSYRIDGLTPGPHDVTMNAFGYQTSDTTIAVASGLETSLDVALEPERLFITGEVRDSRTLETIVGAIVSYAGGSTPTDNLGRYQLSDVPPGTYTLKATAAGFDSAMHEVVVAEGGYTASDFALAPINPWPGTTRTFVPIADADVNVGGPGNYGTASKMRVRGGSTEYRCFLKFVPTGFFGPVQNARLRLFCTSPSNDAGSVYRVINGWTEFGITGLNAPSLTGNSLASGGPGTTNAWVDFDVTSVVQAGDTVSFGLCSTATASCYFSTREGPQAPQLVVRFSGGPSISSFAPSSGPPGMQVTIAGGNFTGTTAVTFNGATSPSLVVDNDGRLRAVVPGSATSGPISVTNAVSITTSSASFVVTPPPTILSLSPASGPAGTSVTVQGTNFSGATTVAFNGTPSQVLHVESDGVIHTVVPAGATSGPISVTNAIGTGSSAQNFLFTPSSGVAEWCFRPQADAQVSAIHPSTNYGSLQTLRARSDQYRSYLKFDVQGFDQPVRSATLRLYATDSSKAGGMLSSASIQLPSGVAWAENAITWDNSPALLDSLWTIGPVAIGSWVERDVARVIGGAGTYAFGITSTSSNSAYYSSKEGTQPPELVLLVALPVNALDPGPHAAVALRAPYPNPFRGSTVIEYGLMQEGHVRLTIYNVAGQVVRKLADRFETKGSFQATWNGLDDRGRLAPAGLYLYRLDCPGTRQSGKLLLLR